MTRLLSVDPGVRGCGLALFHGGTLSKATYLKNPVSKGSGVSEAALMAVAVFTWAGPTNQLAVEVPRIYAPKHQKGDQNDNIDVAGIAFAVAGQAARFMQPGAMTTYYPREWKGTIDPDVMIERIKGRLSPEERECILPVRDSLMHNVYDAIGIGLKKLGRLEPRRIIARGK